MCIAGLPENPMRESAEKSGTFGAEIRFPYGKKNLFISVTCYLLTR